MHPIAGIAFDLEGTVVDVELAHHQAHIFAAKVIGVELSMEDFFKKIPHFIGGPDRTIAEEVSGLVTKAGTQEWTDSVGMFLVNDQRQYKKLLGEMPVQPRAGFLNSLELIHLARLPFSIGSLTGTEEARVLLDRSGLNRYFAKDMIVLREDVKNPKPAPDVWIETARRMGVAPENQLVFEDSPRGVQGAMDIRATAVGMPVYNRPDTVTALYAAGVSRVFADWRDVRIMGLIETLNEERDRRCSCKS